MSQRILYIVTQAPYLSYAGQEALDMMLSGATLDLQVSVCFAHDGVFQLKSNQNNGNDNAIQFKQYSKTYRAFPDFDIENIYVLEQSLLARGLGVDDLLMKVDLIDVERLSQLMSEQHRVMTF